MRHAICGLSLSSSRSAALSNSIRHAITLHHLFERNSLGTPGPKIDQALFCKIQVLHVSKVFQYGFPGMECLRAPGGLGQCCQALLDFAGRRIASMARSIG